MKKKLSTLTLVSNGFVDIGSWCLVKDRLALPEVPGERGVYAFAVDNEVLYVGLASRSLRQRFNFYVRPGVSQRTNVRINGLIQKLIHNGETVRILVARPEDRSWNGFRLSGPEGLEAALIEDFDPPWNMKGSTGKAVTSAPRKTSINSNRRPHGSVTRAVLDFIAKNPGSTEVEIAKGVFGKDAVQPRVNPYCRKLVERGALKRLPTRPATYSIKDFNFIKDIGS